jgi:transcription elongation factor Elf1
MSTRMQLLCLILIGLTLAAATSHLRRRAPRREAEPGQQYAYCPECGLELTITPGADRKHNFCPHCGVDHPMQVNGFSRTNGEAPVLGPNRLLVAAIFGVPAALAVGVYSLSRKRGQPKQADGEEVFQFSCPSCGHTIASNSYRKGSTAVCPACAELFVVAGSSPEDGLDRSDEEHELEDGLRSKLRNKKFGRPKKPR